jgi:hypothetical protein
MPSWKLRRLIELAEVQHAGLSWLAIARQKLIQDMEA